MRRLARIELVAVVLTLVACGESSRRDAGDDAGDSAGEAGAEQGSGGTGGARGGQGGNAAGNAGTAAGQAGTGGRAGANNGGSEAGTGNPDAGRSGAGDGGSASGRAGASGAAGNGAGVGGAGDGGMAAGGAGGSGGGGATVEEQLAALDETVKAFCAAAEGCCAANGVPAMLDDCESAEPADPVTIASIGSGAVTVDMTAVSRCRAVYADASNACNMNVLVEACEDIFVGHRGVDESCTGGYDCDRSGDDMSCMFLTGSDTLGVCKKIVRAGLDEPCDFFCRAGEDCSGSTYGTIDSVSFCYEDDDLFCEYLESGSVCRPIVAVGEACDSGSSFDVCGSRARCEGTCVRLNDYGEECGSGCISRFTCEDDLCTDPTWARDDRCAGDPIFP
jgi:hypothetical protein